MGERRVVERVEASKDMSQLSDLPFKADKILGGIAHAPMQVRRSNRSLGLNDLKHVPSPAPAEFA